MENMYQVPGEVNIEIEKVILSVVAGYQDQYIRPYDLKVRHEDLNNLEEVVSKAINSANSSVNPIELTNKINILEPISTPIGKSEIVGGWDQSRAVFILTAKWVDPFKGVEEVLYLTGYSDYPELNPTTGTVSEKINLYPNTAILLNRIETVNGPVLKIVHSFTIEYETDENKLTIKEDYSFNDDKLLLRPYDTLAVVENITQSLNSIPVESTLLNTNAVEREDFIPVNHVTTVINSLLQGSYLTNSIYEEDTIKTSKLASKKIELGEIEFFRKLIQQRGTTPGLSFPLSWLFKLDPTLTGDRIGVVNYMAGNTILNTAAMGQLTTNENVFNNNIPMILTSNIGENAGDATLESRTAVLIRDAVSSLMTKNMLMDISFSINNNTLDNSIIFQPYFALPAIHGINLIALVEKFKLEFINMIMPQITKKNSMIIDADIYSSITGETKIAISINGREKRLFNFPTFADSLYNSLITDKNMFINTTNNYKSLVDQTLAAVEVNMGDVTSIPLNDHYTF